MQLSGINEMCHECKEVGGRVLLRSEPLHPHQQRRPQLLLTTFLEEDEVPDGFHAQFAYCLITQR